MLRNDGWRVNHKRVERIWRKEGLKVPAKQPKRSRLWLNDGSCVRLRPQYPNPVWSYDFVQERTHNGRAFRILNIIDEYTRERLASYVARNIRQGDVQECLTELFCQRGVPAHLRSDNGPEFTAKMLREWLSKLSIGTLFIEPGSPWENGYVESFDGRMRDELLDREIFYTLKEARHLIERWRGGIQSHQTAQFTWLQTASSSSVDRCAGAVSGGESNIRSGPNSGGRSSDIKGFHRDQRLL